MGNSTVQLATMFDAIAAQGVPDPRLAPSGYGDTLALTLANTVIADLIAERYNWKWNSALATPLLTNSWQQDYPRLAQAKGIIGWGERCDMVDINNTMMPKPLWQLTWRRQLSRVSTPAWLPSQICWMYNCDLTLGVWPGPGVTYYPLLGLNAPAGQNPLMSMMDANGNILIVTGFGTTGTVAPAEAANSAEGVKVADGSVTWTVVSPTSQGFRLDALPSATGPVYLVAPVYQIDPPRFTTLQQLLNPIPDSFSMYFLRGLKSAMLMASTNPGDLKRGMDARGEWLNGLHEAMKQGDRETNAYSLLPLTQVVEQRWRERRGPYTADQPY
jgi:hypothetical protein